MKLDAFIGKPDTPRRCMTLPLLAMTLVGLSSALKSCFEDARGDDEKPWAQPVRISGDLLDERVICSEKTGNGFNGIPMGARRIQAESRTTVLSVFRTKDGKPGYYPIDTFPELPPAVFDHRTQSWVSRGLQKDNPCTEERRFVEVRAPARRTSERTGAEHYQEMLELGLYKND